jgi:hypothetical protein
VTLTPFAASNGIGAERLERRAYIQPSRMRKYRAEKNEEAVPFYDMLFRHEVDE